MAAAETHGAWISDGPVSSEQNESLLMLVWISADVQHCCKILLKPLFVRILRATGLVWRLAIEVGVISC
jgi:hypothetical protein